jgi:hypothetical protein
MFRRSFIAVSLWIGGVSVAAATTFRDVDIRIVPPQPVKAISIRAGEETRSVAVRNGKARIPSDLPAPWSLQLVRFEADVYTTADLDAKRPWIIRELGIVRGRIERRSAVKGEPYTWLLAGTKSDDVREADFTLDDRGAFEIRLAAGIYHGAVLGPACGTRVRSGIVVKPGQQTDVGTLAAEPAVPVSVRVVDAAGRDGVGGARLIWDPSGDTMLNSDLSRRLYARRWGAVTDRRGIAEVKFVGPLPHSARWRIETEGFAPTHTANALLREPIRFAMPDVRLRPEPAMTVRVSMSREAREELDGARLVTGEQLDSHSLDFVPVYRVPLREAEHVFRFKSYGLKQLWVENREGTKLAFQTVEVKSPSSIVDFEVRPVEISGRVTLGTLPLADAYVILSDPVKARPFLGQATADDDGRFRFRTWAVGKMRVYAGSPRSRSGPGRRFGTASTSLDLTGKREVAVDLAIPSSGVILSFVDAETNTPVQARFVMRVDVTTGRGWSVDEEADEHGRAEVSGFPEGTATVYPIEKNYRFDKVADIPVRTDQPEITIRMHRAKPSSLRVIDLRGAPIVGARVVGGFINEHENPFHSGTTDAHGRVELDPSPAAGTMFYVAASGFALGMTTLEPDREATVVLHPPSSSILTLRKENAPPDKVFLVMAAPAGREFIPLNAIEELAEANGMNLFQISGSSPAGDVVLPEFLGPGTYDLFLARRGGTPFLYERFGTIRTPLPRNAILAVK